MVDELTEEEIEDRLLELLKVEEVGEVCCELDADCPDFWFCRLRFWACCLRLRVSMWDVCVVARATVRRNSCIDVRLSKPKPM